VPVSPYPPTLETCDVPADVGDVRQPRRTQERDVDIRQRAHVIDADSDQTQIDAVVGVEHWTAHHCERVGSRIENGAAAPGVAEGNLGVGAGPGRWGDDMVGGQDTDRAAGAGRVGVNGNDRPGTAAESRRVARLHSHHGVPGRCGREDLGEWRDREAVSRGRNGEGS